MLRVPFATDHERTLLPPAGQLGSKVVWLLGSEQGQAWKTCRLCGVSSRMRQLLAPSTMTELAAGPQLALRVPVFGVGRAANVRIVTSSNKPVCIKGTYLLRYRMCCLA